MASYSWASPISGDWNKAANWTPAAVPNDALANVTIDNPTLAAYLVTIAAGESVTVNSLSLNAVNNLKGSNQDPYIAAEMELDGTLAFGAGSAGTLGGSLQTFIETINGTIINPGTVNGFIQAQGNVLFTGTNGFYVTNWLQSLAAVTTIDTKSIAEMTGNTLFDGIYEAKGPGAIINLGGPRQNLIVNIATIEGPPLIPDGWTELILNGTLNDIGEWNGTGYVGIETTLTTIASRGTFDIIGGRSYTSANSLTISPGGLLNLSAGAVTTGTININGGTVQGSGTINSGIINNGTLRVVDGLLTTGTAGLVGTGLVTFDYDQKFGTIAATGGIMEVHGVGPGQLFVMNGNDTLVLDTPSSFAGQIQAKAGDTILLGGVVATSATLSGQTLLLQNAGKTVASLNLWGSYTGESFVVSAFGVGSTAVKIAAKSASSSSSSYGTPVVTEDGSTTNISMGSLGLTATGPGAFITTYNGSAVLDGGSGSSFMTGDGLADTFYVDTRAMTDASFSTIANLHSGDDVTILGFTPQGFNVALFDNGGAPGHAGLTFQMNEAGHATSNVVLAGYSTADLTNGRLSQSFGTTSGGPAGSGVSYLNIHVT